MSAIAVCLFKSRLHQALVFAFQYNDHSTASTSAASNRTQYLVQNTRGAPEIVRHSIHPGSSLEYFAIVFFVQYVLYAALHRTTGAQFNPVIVLACLFARRFASPSLTEMRVNRSHLETGKGCRAGRK